MHQVTIQQGNYTIDWQSLMSTCNQTQLVFTVQTIPSITITYWHTRWCIDHMHWYQEKKLPLKMACTLTLSVWRKNGVLLFVVSRDQPVMLTTLHWTLAYLEDSDVTTHDRSYCPFATCTMEEWIGCIVECMVRCSRQGVDLPQWHLHIRSIPPTQPRH